MKVLITADIHLDDYPNYNFKPFSRLGQFQTLAERLLEMRKQYNCDEIWILGDFVRKPVQSNKANYALFSMLSTLTSASKVRYIIGNHDLSAKVQTSVAEDTILSLVDFDKQDSNFIYMSNGDLTFGNNHYFFMDWKPKQDWSWVEGRIKPGEKVIYCGHYTHARKNDFWHKQEIIGPEPDMFIFGDIHKHYVDGKYVSIGVPVQGNMGDEACGHCIILDTDTAEYKHVETDPEHKYFLRMEYTPVKEDEGFYDDGLTYKVYKPAIKKSERTTTVSNWDDVEQLIGNVILKEGLTDIHSRILAKNPKYGEMDFNFKLINLHIQGYRSLVDVNIPFDGDHEVVVLCGENGSGKSSVINALASMFRKNRYLKGDRSDLCDEFRIELKLEYQNKVYTIVKGENTNMAFYIDGEEQHYSGIPEMEASIEQHLPFIAYLDMMFQSSDEVNFEDKLSDNRRIDLIRKFYRLDRLDAYHDEALKMYNDVKDDVTRKKTEYDGLVMALEDVKTGLEDSRAKVAGYILADIEKEIEDTKSAQLKNLEWEKWAENKRRLEIERDVHKENLKFYNGQISDEIAELEKTVNELTELEKEKAEECENLEESKRTRDDLLLKIANWDKQIKDWREEKSALESSRCPKCGQLIKTEEATTLLNEVTNNIKRAELDRGTASMALQTLEGVDQELQETTKELKKVQADLRSTNRDLSSKKGELTTMVRTRKQLEDIEKQLSEIGEEPEHVNVDLTRFQELLELKTQFDHIEKLNKDAEELRQGIATQEQEVADGMTMMTNLQRYTEATSTNGIIMAEILRVLADNFNETSNGDITYGVTTGVFRNKPFIEFNQFFNVAGKNREYSHLSSGQKTLCDIEFLQRLFVSQVGVLILDESFKFLSDTRFQEIQQSLRKLNVNTIMVTTHDPNFSIYTRRYYLTLDENGATVMNE